MQDIAKKVYVSIDLKSFFASVECQERGLDPIKTNLVVADNSRTEKTICLAVSPALKQYGISGRARLFEVIEKVRGINIERKKKAPKNTFTGSSYDDIALKKNPDLELTYIIAPPRMSYYMKYSTNIYNIYLKYFSPEDICVYSIDEVFIDITNYLKLYKMKARDLVTHVIHDVYNTTGITATAGIGTNMYLAKVAMDIVAKHAEPNENGVRIAGLDEMTYRKLLWNHKPITDFWRVGKGYANRLSKYRIFTMGDIAKMSIENEDFLYKLFGINAELLIDHAWGWEPCTIKEIKAYKPVNNSISSGQVLHCPYNFKDAEIIVKEMAENLSLDLVRKMLVTDQIVLDIIYDVENLTDKNISDNYKGEIEKDRYGREIPKPAHGSINIDHKTSSTRIIMENTLKLYNKIADKNLLIRKINITANKVVNEKEAQNIKTFQQIDMFTSYEEIKNEEEREKKEKELQKAVIDIKNKYGKNAIHKGMNFEKSGTMRDRNNQVGGHKA